MRRLITAALAALLIVACLTGSAMADLFTVARWDTYCASYGFDSYSAMGSSDTFADAFDSGATLYTFEEAFDAMKVLVIIPDADELDTAKPYLMNH